MDIILTHENGDFDAVAGLLAASRLYGDSVPVLPERLNQNVARFLTLYGAAFPFVRQSDLKARTINHIVLVDTQRMVQLKHTRSDVTIEILDHHSLNMELPSGYTFTFEAVGAVTTWLVEEIQKKSIHLTSLEATLLMLGIYEDTGSLTYATTTPRDLLAAGWLLEQQAVMDTVRRFLAPTLSVEQQKLLELVLKHIQTRDVQGYSISISALRVEDYVHEVSGVAHRLRDLLDSAGIFLVVEMPNGTLLVARSTVDAIDVGAIARAFGGGGHGRAAAATIRDRALGSIVSEIWTQLEAQVLPATRIADLMSYGVQTVDVDQPLSAVIRRLRQIGHEGYPVVETGRIVGLLTRRDLDRADEHQMRDLLVGDVMSAGNVSLTPDASIFALEKVFADTGWGQIPIVDAAGQLIGIVTRTDLLKHWYKLHPAAYRREQTITSEKFEAILGRSVMSYIQMVADHAQSEAVTVYLVGGVVRDLVLGRANFDIDFVVEGDAILFAQSFQQRHEGDLTVFTPFGTAKWKPSGTMPEAAVLIDHIDFASARYEFYEHPTALPTVYDSSIKLDLQRRDFTINTLAIQISPLTEFGRVVDFYGGLRDLDAKLVRVLHSLSFIDDPTRILRAFRFTHRLGFAIEKRTAELITVALPMLGRITGERLRNEINLLLREDQPEVSLLALQEHGVLTAIHADFVLDHHISEDFQCVRSAQPDKMPIVDDQTELYWHILLCRIEPDVLRAICDRLMFGRKVSDSLLQAATVMQHVDELARAGNRPSSIVSRLEAVSPTALVAIWYASDDVQVRAYLERYWTEWRLVRPLANGDTLQQLGVKAGPCYRVILARLRQAWLDGLVHHETEERQLLDRLIHDERICGDHA